MVGTTGSRMDRALVDACYYTQLAQRGRPPAFWRAMGMEHFSRIFFPPVERAYEDSNPRPRPKRDVPVRSLTVPDVAVRQGAATPENLVTTTVMTEEARFGPIDKID